MQPAGESDVVQGGQEEGEGMGRLRGGRQGSSGTGVSAVCLDLAGSSGHVCRCRCWGQRGPHGMKPGRSGCGRRHVLLRHTNKHRKKLLQVIRPACSNRLQWERLHLNGHICPCVQATATHRKTCTERYVFPCEEKAYVLCF